MEEKDKILLSDCKKAIYVIKVVIYLWQNITISVVYDYHIKINFELGKMAVDVNYQGLQFGQQLLSFAIEFAIGSLYSSTKLPAAAHL